MASAPSSRGLVEAGAFTSRKSIDCHETANVLSTLGFCVPLPFDLSASAGTAGLVASLFAREPRLNIRVNNAGAAWGAPLPRYPESGWDKVIGLNLKPPLFVTQMLLPSLKRAGRADDPGLVINIASIKGLTSQHTDDYAYSTSKAAVIHLTRHLATALAKDHINVNAIAPGYFATQMMAHVVDFEHAMAVAVPRGRGGCPEDMIGAMIYLSSLASAWVTGVALPAGGDMTVAACSASQPVGTRYSRRSLHDHQI